MNQPGKWFERRFAFGTPVEMLPNLLARLRGTPARLEEELRGVSAAVLTARREGEWSAQENAGHLADMEPLWVARVEDYVLGKSDMTAADLLNRRTYEANHNSGSVETILAEFRRARSELVRRVEELDAAAFEKAIGHPRLKTPMRLPDHLFFVAEHDDHHLAQIHAQRL